MKRIRLCALASIVLLPHLNATESQAHEAPPPPHSPPKTDLPISQRSAKLGGQVQFPVTSVSDGLCFGHAKVFGAYQQLLKTEKGGSKLGKLKFPPGPDGLLLEKLVTYFQKNPSKYGVEYTELVNDRAFADLVRETHGLQESDWTRDQHKIRIQNDLTKSSSKNEVPSVIAGLQESMGTDISNKPVLAWFLPGTRGGHAVTVDSWKKVADGYILQVNDSLLPTTMTNEGSAYSELKIDSNGRILSFRTPDGRDVFTRDDLPGVTLETYRAGERYRTATKPKNEASR